jgi:hypothetical protein
VNTPVTISVAGCEDTAVAATTVGVADTVRPSEKVPRTTTVERMTCRTTGAVSTLAFGGRLSAAACDGDCTHPEPTIPPADNRAAATAVPITARRRRPSREPSFIARLSR